MEESNTIGIKKIPPPFRVMGFLGCPLFVFSLVNLDHFPTGDNATDIFGVDNE